MDPVSGRDLLCAIHQGFVQASEQTNTILRAHGKSATTRLSAKFVSDVAHSVGSTVFGQHDRPTVIGVDPDGIKTPGEWLVDACITVKNERGFVERVVFAMESESDTSEHDFNVDFAKLIHLNASVKLYLNGVNQKTSDGMEDYIQRRICYASEILKRTRHNGQLFIGFWPSPGKLHGETCRTAWKQFSKFPHLRKSIRLWEFEHALTEIQQSGN